MKPRKILVWKEGGKEEGNGGKKEESREEK